jgi:hypothetical protein
MEELERPDPLDVEPMFNGFIVEYGGELVGSRIPQDYKGLNADYVFKNENVIAELKCFRKTYLMRPTMLTELMH